ncbi:MAG: hypothetical protein HOP28_06280 [Gemmatimonadales bacterium]|nr:hypothetical protein [Gemmatimonadales bacterium]
MRVHRFLLSSALAAPLFLATSAIAQRVEADIRIGGGPIGGRIVIRDRDRDDYRNYRPRQISRVHWIRVRDRRDFDRFQRFQRGARVVVVFYDRRDDRYYDRFRPGLFEIRLFERDGRFFRLDDDRYGRDDYRWDNRRDGRRDDRRDDRRDGRRDDRGNRDNRDRDYREWDNWDRRN